MNKPIKIVGALLLIGSLTSCASLKVLSIEEGKQHLKQLIYDSYDKKAEIKTYDIIHSAVHTNKSGRDQVDGSKVVDLEHNYAIIRTYNSYPNAVGGINEDSSCIYVYVLDNLLYFVETEMSQYSTFEIKTTPEQDFRETVNNYGMPYIGMVEAYEGATYLLNDIESREDMMIDYSISTTGAGNMKITQTFEESIGKDFEEFHNEITLDKYYVTKTSEHKSRYSLDLSGTKDVYEEFDVYSEATINPKVELIYPDLSQLEHIDGDNFQ